MASFKVGGGGYSPALASTTPMITPASPVARAPSSPARAVTDWPARGMGHGPMAGSRA